MGIANALAILGAGLGGLGRGMEQDRQRQRQDEDDAFRREQRARTRLSWEREDKAYNEAEAEKQAMRDAAAPVEVKQEQLQGPTMPDEAPLPMANKVGGQAFASPAEAQAAADKANAMPARMQRVAGVMRDPVKAAEMAARANRAELDTMNLEQAKVAEAAKAFDRDLVQSFTKGGWEGFAKFLSDSPADGQGGAAKFAVKKEGGKVTVYPVGPDGTAMGQGFTEPDTERGKANAAFRFARGTTLQQKLVHFRQEQLDQQAEENRLRDDKRAEKAEERRRMHEDRMYQLDLRKTAVSERAASARAAGSGGQGGGAAPMWDDKADQFLRERYTVKDPNTGSVGVDGNGMQFSKLIALAQSQRNGGDTTRALGFAFEKDNELRAAATDPKKGYDGTRHNQLRAQYLQALTAPAQPPAAAPAAAPAPNVPQPRAGMSAAAGADPLNGLSRQQARAKRAELVDEQKKWKGKPNAEARVAELQALIERIDNGQF